MAKYHIKKDGTPGVCRAKEGNCPLGGGEGHFDSIEAAQEYADNNFSESWGLFSNPNEKENKLTQSS